MSKLKQSLKTIIAINLQHQREMNKEQIENLKEEIIDALHDSMDVDDNSVDIRLFEINLTSVLEWTFNTKDK